MKILVLNGPNINMLGVRETDLYGATGYEELIAALYEEAEGIGVELDVMQTNSEGEIISAIQEAQEYDGIILNPGGYTHTSVAILDAIKSVMTPVIEVHVTNIFAREDFRRTTVTGSGALGVIAGLGLYGYVAAMHAFTSDSLTEL